MKFEVHVTGVPATEFDTVNEAIDFLHNNWQFGLVAQIRDSRTGFFFIRKNSVGTTYFWSSYIDNKRFHSKLSDVIHVKEALGGWIEHDGRLV